MMVKHQNITDINHDGRFHWDEVRLECACSNGEQVNLSWDLDPDWDNFMEVDLVPLRRGFFGRIKAATKILFAKEPVFGSVILDEEAIKVFKEFLGRH